MQKKTQTSMVFKFFGHVMCQPDVQLFYSMFVGGSSHFTILIDSHDTVASRGVPQLPLISKQVQVHVDDWAIPEILPHMFLAERMGPVEPT
jgi:hypothetical protein